MFRPLLDALLTRDPFMLLADYQSYVECQSAAAAAYADRRRWTQMSILNSARVGSFSSDRAVRQYCSAIWNVRPLSEARAAATAPVSGGKYRE
jgi:starch phosphorylase